MFVQFQGKCACLYRGINKALQQISRAERAVVLVFFFVLSCCLFSTVIDEVFSLQKFLGCVAPCSATLVSSEDCSFSVSFLVYVSFSVRVTCWSMQTFDPLNNHSFFKYYNVLVLFVHHLSFNLYF